MNLEEITLNHFKKNLYPYYIELFPESERKSFSVLKKVYQEKKNKFLQITREKEVIGFMILNFLPNVPFAFLDYFAIIPQYQNRGYGKKALKELQKLFSNYQGILLEAEAVGYGTNEEERKRRASFYQRAGFCPLKYQLELYQVIYTPYVLFMKEKIEESKVIEVMFEFYKEMASPMSEEKFTQKYKYRKL